MSVLWQPLRAALAALGHAEEVLVSVGPGEWGGDAEGPVDTWSPGVVFSHVCASSSLCTRLSWLFIHCCDTMTKATSSV